METQLKDNYQRMDDNMFHLLISVLHPEDDSSLDQVALKAELMNYEINIYADSDKEYEMIVEDFGHGSHKNWIQLEPTSNQFKILEQKIKQEISRLEYLREENPKHEFYDDKEHGIYGHGY